MEGKQGPAGPFIKTLPSTSTETGTWIVGPTAAEGSVKVAISSAISLAAPLSDEKECEADHPCQAHVINVAGEEINAAKKHPRHTAKEPWANRQQNRVTSASTQRPAESVVFSQLFGGILDPATGTALGVSEEGPGETGAILSARTTAVDGTAYVSWAATAP